MQAVWETKWEELEAFVSSQSYGITGTGETWWKESLEWAAGCWGGAAGRRGGGVALDVRERFDCRALRVGGDVVESLWVKIREVENKGDLVGVRLKELFAC